MLQTALQANLTESELNARLVVGLATSPEEIHQGMRLRYRVFANEMGAKLKSHGSGMDQDEFDDFCQHMLVRDTLTEEIVGYTRILTDSQAHRAGSFYSQTEFDLSNLLTFRRRFMEIGRTCVHPQYRGGSVIAILWSGLARFMTIHEMDYLMGCASIPMTDGGVTAVRIMSYLREHHYSNEDKRVFPKHPLPSLGMRSSHKPPLPALLKGYLRLGVEVCGEPHWDRDFNVADVFVLLDRDQINQRYVRHFLRRLDAPA